MILTKTMDITLGQAGIYGLLGYAVVFFGLILLMIVVILFGKAFSGAEKKPKVVGDAAHIVPNAKPAESPKAPGSAGQLKLHNVEPKTAALLMAIVAEKTGKPINELRFISIKEVDE